MTRSLHGMSRRPAAAVTRSLRVGIGAVLLAATVAIAPAAGAQAAGTLRSLDGRASAALKAQIATVADSVVRLGLPVAPLIDKALEGISKGANDQRILAAVRGMARDLGIARDALGPSSEAELAAAVAALRGGSSSAQLSRLRNELPGRPLVVPLSVLASLLVDGAPASSAVVAVVTNARQSDDAALIAYGRGVSSDIAKGVAPLTAIAAPQPGTPAAAGSPISIPGKPPILPHSPVKPKP